MKNLRVLALATGLLSVAAPVMAGAKAPAATQDEEHLAPEIPLDKLEAAVTSKSATIIDVNSSESYKSGHIPGAIHFGTQESQLANLLPKDKNALIVAYCGGPMCTAWQSAAKEAKKLGYTNIVHFKGGISGWKGANKPVEKA